MSEKSDEPEAETKLRIGVAKQVDSDSVRTPMTAYDKPGAPALGDRARTKPRPLPLIGIVLLGLALFGALAGASLLMSNGGNHSGVGGGLQGLANAIAWILLVGSGIAGVGAGVILVRSADDNTKRAHKDGPGHDR